MRLFLLWKRLSKCTLEPWNLAFLVHYCYQAEWFCWSQIMFTCLLEHGCRLPRVRHPLLTSTGEKPVSCSLLREGEGWRMHGPGGPWRSATGLACSRQETHTSLSGTAMSCWIWGTLQGILHSRIHMTRCENVSCLPTISVCIRPKPNSLSFSKGSPRATAAHYWSHTYCPKTLACDQRLRPGCHCS